VAESATAKTYAGVLCDLGREKGLLDSFAAEILAVNSLVASEKDFSIFLNLPSVGAQEKKRFIQKVFSQAMTPEFVDFLCVLADNGRITELEEIEKVFSALIDDEKKSIRVSMTTSMSLDDALRAKTVQMLSKKFGKSVILEEKVDSSIIGGMVIRAGDTVIDGSVATRIRRMKEKLLLSTIKGEAVYEDKD
jgi:F-type H+-transporting ATPase subunit delta